jgi:hypothetical protein
MLKTHAYLSTQSAWTANSWALPGDALATGRKLDQLVEMLMRAPGGERIFPQSFSVIACLSDRHWG